MCLVSLKGVVFTMFFWIVVGALAVVQGLIMLTGLRIRSSPQGLGGPVGSRPMEIVWTAVPAVILIAVVILSFQALQDEDEQAAQSEAAFSGLASAMQGRAVAGQVLLPAMDGTEGSGR